MAEMWQWAARICIYSAAAAMTGGATCMLIVNADLQAGEWCIQAEADMRPVVVLMAVVAEGSGEPRN
jgi:hypothetical protein